MQSAGRAADAARRALRAALGDRLRGPGPDRTESLAHDNTVLHAAPAVTPVGGALRVVRVPLPTAAVFEGFLDGIQRSAMIAYLDGVPLLHGTAAAVIRRRDAWGRMHTWAEPLIAHGGYVSRSVLGATLWAQVEGILGANGQSLHDTDTQDSPASRHPSALLRQGLDALSRVRNDLERDAGEAWCLVHGDRPLYVDGSLRTSASMLRSAGVVGVVKSHATLYVPDADVPRVLSLGAGERTSLIAVMDADGGSRYLTWYLRLRSAAGRDPFFGLIRVEIGAGGRDAGDAEARADAASSALLAERAPLAKPDGRWDVMPYAIRDCEVYLRAVA